MDNKQVKNTGTIPHLPPGMPGEEASSAFEKRIKRRVTSREHDFFAATALGLEDLARTELLALGIPEEKTAVVPGGVTFSGKLCDCYRANLHLRTANRVLMRLDEFKASAFPELEKKLARIDWELFLPAKGEPILHVTSAKSRLYHKEAVAQRIRESIQDRGPLPDGPPIHIFVRLDSDRVTLSLDSSGELLHRRGVKTRVGHAPLRETLAAAILLFSGYQPGEVLLDPMCGSGTFSLEAATMGRRIPAGWFRDFAFMRWPAFAPGQWRHLRREAEAAMIPSAAPHIFASDKDAQAVALLTEALGEFGLTDAVQAAPGNFFTLMPPASPPGLVVLNPPYGHRLGSSSGAPAFYSDICDKLRKDFKGWKVALLAPATLPISRRSMFTRQVPLTHGGLDLVLLTGEI